MHTIRIRLGHPAGQTPPHIFSDFDWARIHLRELYAQYGCCVVVIYKEKVIGRGETLQVAIDDAENNLPPDIAEITPILYHVDNPDSHEWFIRRMLRGKPENTE